MRGSVTAMADDAALVRGHAPTEADTMTDTAEPLELRLWQGLSTCVSMMDARMTGRLRDGFGTTRPRFDLLSALDRAPDGLTMGELSKRLMVTNGNVTGIVERLVNDGLAVRATVPADRRTHRVRLTPAGRDACRGMAAAQQQWLADMTAALPREEMADLLALLGRLKRCLSGAVGAR